MVDGTLASVSHSGTAATSDGARERNLEYRDMGTALAASVLVRDIGSRTEDCNVDAGSIYAQPFERYLLVDVTAEAKRAGFAGLTAITANLWHDFISLPLAYTGGQDEVGRLRNVLNRAVAEATHFGNFTNILIEFQVALIGPHWVVQFEC